MFSTASGANQLLASTRLPLIIELLEEAFDVDHAPTVQVAATLAFNFSLYISREDIDTLLAFLVPTVHALNNKNTSLTDDVAYAFLMTLGKLLYQCNEAVDVAKSLELNLTPYTTSSTAKVQGVAAEVQKILQCTSG